MTDNTIEIAKEIIHPGQTRRLDLPVSRLPTQTMLSLPITVVNGVAPGPRLSLSAAIHGDELNGVEIIRQVLAQIKSEKLRGTLLAVPIVNIFGFRDGSLRQAATKKGIPVLLYEAGEALRFDSNAIATGVQGILRVMNCLEMYDLPENSTEFEPIEVTESKWIRASRGGIFHLKVNLGEQVTKKQELGFITDVVGEYQVIVRASVPGIVLSHSLNPLVNQGDAIVHLAVVK